VIDSAEVGEFFAVLPYFRFGLLALGDVHARADVARNVPSGAKRGLHYPNPSDIHRHFVVSGTPL
jgi:hypothetical protein